LILLGEGQMKQLRTSYEIILMVRHQAGYLVSWFSWLAS